MQGKKKKNIFGSQDCASFIALLEVIWELETSYLIRKLRNVLYQLSTDPRRIGKMIIRASQQPSLTEN